MCLDLFTQIVSSDKERGPHQKTIIFCARDRHADDVAAAMNNLYAQWCASKGVPRKDPYAFKCTAKSSGNAALPDLRLQAVAAEQFAGRGLQSGASLSGTRPRLVDRIRTCSADADCTAAGTKCNQ